MGAVGIPAEGPQPLVLTEDRDGARVRLAVCGEVDLATVEQFRGRLLALIGTPGVDKVVVDLGGTAFLDASGVAVLIAAERLARHRGVALGVLNCRAIVRRVLEICGGLDKILLAD
jgi:anti-anti-sigma factor